MSVVALLSKPHAGTVGCKTRTNVQHDVRVAPIAASSAPGDTLAAPKRTNRTSHIDPLARRRLRISRCARSPARHCYLRLAKQARCRQHARARASRPTHSRTFNYERFQASNVVTSVPKSSILLPSILCSSRCERCCPDAMMSIGGQNVRGARQTGNCFFMLGKRTRVHPDWILILCYHTAGDTWRDGS